jgi:hypothetical protein
MRRQVVEIQCDRCERVERQPVEDGVGQVLGIDPASGEDWTALVVCLMVDGKPVVQFAMKTLCTPCTKTVKNHLEAIRKPIKGSSPNRKALPPATTSSSVVDLGAKKKAQGRP